MGILEGVAPEIVLHALEAALVQEPVEGALEVIANLGEGDVEDAGASDAVGVVEEPVRMVGDER